MKTLLTVKEAAERMRVAAATVYLLCAQGRLVHLRVGAGGRGTIRVREEDLQIFIEGATVQPEARPAARRRGENRCCDRRRGGR